MLIAILRRLWCEWRGHVWQTPPGAHSVCVRCYMPVTQRVINDWAEATERGRRVLAGDAC